jgi:exopolysaccharide biosynthesis operon protein EpsL
MQRSGTLMGAMICAAACLDVPLLALAQQQTAPLPGTAPPVAQETAPLPGTAPPVGYSPPPIAPREPSQRTFGLVVGAFETWDSNLFRLPDAASPQSDRIATAYVGLRIDKVYQQQEFRLNVTQSAVRYNKFSYLNFDPLDYGAAWLWHVSPRVSGTLTADRTQHLYSYQDTRNITQRNITTNNNYRFTADGSLFGGWHLLAEALYNKVDNEVAVPATPNYSESGGGGGVKYVSPSNNFIAANFRSVRGDYNRPLDSVAVFDNGYSRNQGELLTEWATSAKSKFHGRVAWIDYKADNFSQRDFSGPAGRLVYTWIPTAALQFDFSAIRDLQSYWDNLSSYRIVDVYSFVPVWTVSSRFVLRGELAYETDDYRQPVIPYNGPLRSDNTRRAAIGLDWAPTGNVTLGASVQREKRDSNFDFDEYSDTLGRVTATLRF